MIKSAIEDASFGIAQSSVVLNDPDFEKRVRFLLRKAGHEVLAEEYVAGKEIYISVLGGNRLRIFPMREIYFGRLAEGGGRPVATFRLKWDKLYRRKMRVCFRPVKGLEKAVVRKIEEVCRSAYKALRLKGHARIDMRVTESGEPYILEVNPNPYLARDEEFAMSAKWGGLSFEALLQTLLDAAL